MPTAKILKSELFGVATPRWRFPLRPRPYPHEFAPGYLIRVAGANGYDSPLSFWRTLSRRYREPLVGLRYALNLVDADLTNILGPYPAFTGIAFNGWMGLRADDFNHHWLRWCPLCIEESPYLRIEWGVKLCCVCRRHQILLADRCPSCGAKQKYLRADLGHCACCCASLADGAVLAVPQPWVDLVQRLMNGLYMAEPPKASTMIPGDWLRMVRYLGQICIDPAIRRPGQISGLHEIEVAIAFVKAVSEVLANWPMGMHGLLQRLRAAHPGSSHIGDAFGTLYRVLYRQLATPCFDFLREAFEAYLHEHWFGLLGRRNRRLSIATISTHPRKPVRAIAAEAGAGRKLVCHLADQGRIEGLAVHHKSRRTTRVISESEALKIAGYVSDSITVLQASAMLGITRGRVRELIAARLLIARIHRESGSASTWLLSRSSVESLAQLGGDLQELEPKCSPDFVCLRAILKYWQLDKTELPTLLLVIEKKILNPLGRTSGLAGISGLTLVADEVRSWLERYRTESQQWFSIDSAAKQLGVKQQVAYHLAKIGLLTTDNAGHGGGALRIRVHRDAINEFQKTFVALIDLARARRLSPMSMLKLLPVAPVTGPSVDGGRQYFFRYSDIASVEREAFSMSCTIRPNGIYPH